ncbi:hypothetical protein SeMB42_g00499 [Synchytrium endobioticum]|uniref:Uncharacterized protein n=1 Tax=Synchytrium endobioticum TaxID=286115 RepID=A0A507DQL5_9FUNG|nr:hypothetical protein SeLEV6574_g00073 [Synchytrium endobioticum]TPX53999.1 hypothetical protein SeMB42_g00499 [Synchytrium endobioticum]
MSTRARYLFLCIAFLCILSSAGDACKENLSYSDVLAPQGAAPTVRPGTTHVGSVRDSIHSCHDSRPLRLRKRQHNGVPFAVEFLLGVYIGSKSVDVYRSWLGGRGLPKCDSSLTREMLLLAVIAILAFVCRYPPPCHRPHCDPTTSASRPLQRMSASPGLSAVAEQAHADALACSSWHDSKPVHHHHSPPQSYRLGQFNPHDRPFGLHGNTQNVGTRLPREGPKRAPSLRIGGVAASVPLCV